MHEFCLFVYRGAADVGNLSLSLSVCRDGESDA